MCSTTTMALSVRSFRRYFSAQQLLTRLPCPANTPHAPEDLAGSTAFFPFVGLVVGAWGLAVLAVLDAIGYEGVVPAVAAVAVSFSVTGFFHEDAFADVCDAFGGWTVERRREIMRDSRVGSFGATGVAFLIVAKVAILGSIPGGWISVGAVFVLAHVVARWSSVVMIRVASYVDDPNSLTKPYAGQVTNGRLVVASLIPTIPLAVFVFGPLLAAGVLAGVVVVVVLSSRFFARWLGGITGDCLGAVNQVVEVLIFAIAAHPAVSARLVENLR